MPLRWLCSQPDRERRGYTREDREGLRRIVSQRFSNRQVSARSRRLRTRRLRKIIARWTAAAGERDRRLESCAASSQGSSLSSSLGGANVSGTLTAKNASSTGRRENGAREVSSRLQSSIRECQEKAALREVIILGVGRAMGAT